MSLLPLKPTTAFVMICQMSKETIESPKREVDTGVWPIFSCLPTHIPNLLAHLQKHWILAKQAVVLCLEQLSFKCQHCHKTTLNDSFSHENNRETLRWEASFVFVVKHLAGLFGCGLLTSDKQHKGVFILQNLPVTPYSNPGWENSLFLLSVFLLSLL